MRQQVEGRAHGLAHSIGFDPSLRLQVLDPADDRLAGGRNRIRQTLDLLLQVDRRVPTAAGEIDFETPARPLSPLHLTL